ncbi:MAG: Uma2 family endonuclease [Deltaproteobacteria bacterium]|nr:Uma2 family endonuclease [Deltaproteobacteria bacterium]MDQ3297058.1 Uma2 family endonuclease [Myxococcota bacterium]
MLDPAVLAPETLRPLRRREYEQLVELGTFDDERVELLRGQLVTMSPQGASHATVTARIAQHLIRALDDSFDVRSHSPFAATDDSEPEPDVSVSRRQRRHAYHPSKALLLIEVAASSLRKDRDIKAAIYAENGAPEYWIFDIRTKTVHVYTRPRSGRYASTEKRVRGDVLRPTTLPEISIAVSKMFSGR